MVATTQTSAFERPHRLQGNVLAFLLKRDGEELLHRARTASSGRAARTLAKEGALRTTFVAMRSGATLKQHQVAGPSSIQALDGMARVETAAGTTVLPAGGLMILDGGVPHTLTALEDCTLLVTLVAPS